MVSQIEVVSQMEATSRTKQVRQVQEIRDLCRQMVEQQEDILRAISEKLDALEVDLTVLYAEEIGVEVDAVDAAGIPDSSTSTSISTSKGGLHNAQ